MFDALTSRISSPAGTEDPHTSTLFTSPWSWQRDDGVYVGLNGSVWLYRALPIDPIRWEDPERRLQLGRPLHELLVEIGASSATPFGSMRSLSMNREVHLVSVTWERMATPPEGSSEELTGFLNATFDFTVPQKALLVGVRLRSAAAASPSSSSGFKGLFKQGFDTVSKLLGEAVPGDLGPWQKDLEQVGSVLGRHGARVPTKEELNQLESWYNMGRGPDVEMYEHRSHVDVDDFDRLEFAAVMDFNDLTSPAPYAQWVADAAARPDGPHVVSVRAHLEPAEVSRTRLRRSQRRLKAIEKEDRAAGDLERHEYADTFHIAQEMERYFTDVGEPMLTNCSIIMARRASQIDETYLDFLRSTYKIDVKPLPRRQMPALDETLPTSSKRLNPFLQDVSIPMLAYSGLHAFSSLGDTKGVYAGLVDPDLTPCFIDVVGAPEANKAPAMLVTGAPGSGKTFFSQLAALQARLAGYPVVFINPKAHDDLSGLVEIAGGTRIAMSTLTSQPGILDPFTFCEPEAAAEMAQSHILTVLTDFTQAQKTEITAGLRRGARNGARCVGEALRFIDDESVVRQIESQMEDPMFALGIAKEPRTDFALRDGLTLIEFDRPLQLPPANTSPSDYTMTQAVHLAAVQLVTNAAMWLLAGGQGGVLMVDEAHHFLKEGSQTLAALDRMGREGRSQNILPVFITQRVADVVAAGVDLESYVSRVFCFQTGDEREARAALQLCGLEPTEQRIAWLRDCGPRRRSGETPERWAAALHRDMYGRHAAVLVGPVPARAREAFTTNPAERQERERDQDEETTTGTG